MTRAPKPLGELEFTPEQREWLGLGEADSVRVLAAGSHLVLLERCGASAQVALPWDRDLVMSADVRAFPLADILNLVHTSAKSGFLFFEDGSHAKAVYLHRGEVVFASSNQSFDRLGETLLRVGMISAEAFDTARRAYSPPDRFGRILVERGFLSPRELWSGVKVQVEEIVRSLFAYASGSVCFFEGEVRPDNVVRLALPTRRLIEEGLRRRDELLRFVAWIEQPRTRLVRRRDVCHEFAGTERAVLEALDGRTRFAELCSRAGLDPLTAARTLQLLTLVGAVEVDEQPEADDELERAELEMRIGDEETVAACVRGHAKLLAELSAPIVAVEGAGPIRERLQGVVQEAARRYPELLGELRIGPGGVLDPEDLIARALRFPGDREREVRLALGELVSYVEFDLLNHPRLSEPEQFLEAIEPLRSGL
jgi:Domain of unknown function (DUF4388)